MDWGSAASVFAELYNVIVDRNGDIPTPKRILYEQYNKVFEPLQEKLVLGCSGDPIVLLEEIEKVIRENFKLVPYTLVEEFRKIKGRKGLTNDAFDKVREINDSYYNWCGKRFGYPYKAMAIKKEYSPDKNYTAHFRSISPRCYLRGSLLFIMIGFAAYIVNWFETVSVKGENLVDMSNIVIAATLALLYSLAASIVCRIIFNKK